ncbi:MAG: AAA family ATPase [Candidatus Bathyarchaeota archaeon]|nr:AAA family ATPase [Candidatus Bathyarchaeota archaeon]MDH5688503.1 AAA family ATPase [Candidatus Bathyarchaeota archaeon]
MRLLLVDFEHVLGLNGTINFLKGQPVIFYGENLAGKTNIVNAIRYCLIPKDPRSRKRTYSEEQRLTREEILLSPLEEGSLTIYFLQDDKIFQLAYMFKRSPSGAVRQTQRMYETEAISIPEYEDEELKRFLERLDWKRLDVYSASEIASTMIEIKVYPEILDTLIAPSNVRNFSKTINNEIVTIPRVMSQKISRIRDNVGRYLKNLQTMNNILILEKESYDKQLANLQRDLTKITPKEASKIQSIFSRDVQRNLRAYFSEVEILLEKIPEETKSIENLITELNKEARERIRTIQELANELEDRKEVEKKVERNSLLEKCKTTIDRWAASFQNLPNVGNIDAFIDFEPPEDHRKFNFRLLDQHEEVQSIFSCLEKMRKLLKTANTILKKYEVTLETLPSQITSLKRLRAAIKAPTGEPFGDKAIISYSDEDQKSQISIPVDILIKKPQYMKIHPTPTTHEPREGITDLDTIVRAHLKWLANSISELTKAKKNTGEAEKAYQALKKSLPLLGKEAAKLEERRQENAKEVTSIQSTWNQKYGSLCTTFAFKPEKIDLTTKTNLDSSLKMLDKTIGEARGILRLDLEGKLKEFPEVEMEEETTEREIDRFIKMLTKKIQDLLETKQRCQGIRDWINKHIEEIQDLEQKLKAIALLNILIVVLKEILDPIYEKTDLETITERLAESIEAEVKEAYQRILADESLKFEHIGKGMFRNTLNNEPITHPSGSQRASISLGIMMSLAKTFNLPVILDEATDRYDTNHTKTFIEYIVAMASNLRNPQICLAIYKTMDVEKNPELLSVITGSAIYGIERRSPLDKVIKRIDLSPQTI